MKLVSLISLPLTALAVALTPAIAADYQYDYDPPIFVEQMPEYVPVEVGSGWYLRGDVTYNFSRPTHRFTIGGISANNQRFGGGIGAGYHFSDLFRADATIAMVAQDHFRSGATSFDHTLWAGMVNAYVDLGTVAGFTPYVGAGLGVAYSRDRINLGGGNDRAEDQFRLAYALNAGLAYRMTDNLSLDAGYQFLSSPQMRNAVRGTPLPNEGHLSERIDHDERSCRAPARAQFLVRTLRQATPAGNSKTSTTHCSAGRTGRSPARPSSSARSI
jgi:opacity protein-like surface antigen